MSIPAFSSLAKIRSFAAQTFNIDQRRPFERDAFAFFSVGCALYIWISLASFQPSEGWLYSLSSSPIQTKNLAGIIGNELAGALFFYLGIVSWACPLMILQYSNLIRRASLRSNFFNVTLGWMSLLAALMPVLISLRPTIPFRGYSFSTGGALGQLAAEWCFMYLGETGSLVLLWTALVSALVLITRIEFQDLWMFLKSVGSGAPSGQTQEIPYGMGDRFPKLDVKPKSFGLLSGLCKKATPIKRDQSILPSLFESSPHLESHEYPAPHLGPDFGSIASSIHFREVTPLESEALELSDCEPEHFAAKIPYTTPPVEIFKRTDERTLVGLSQKELEATSQVLVKTLADFGVAGKIIGWQPGPVVTVYEYQPEAGIKQAKILSLLDDIALSLKVDSIFIHPVQGKRALGIQVPNSRRDPVLLGDVLTSELFLRSPSPLTFAMGKTINGTPYCADVTSMPHLLAAGATGTGKSVAINALLCSIIMKSSPDDVRMILVDPKMLELSVYDGIPHLLMPVITEPDRASSALKWAASEMERRYKLMQHAQVRNIGGFNTFWGQAGEIRQKELRNLMGDDSIQRLPYILLVIDELADLMLTAPKDVETSIQRLAQKARASGIHMVLATQRPSVDVITGVIKANLPCRLSFQVVSKHDSRTILDQVGSEKLLGKGDILLQRPGIGKLERLQGALVSDEEVLALVASAKSSYKASYDERAMIWIDEEVTKHNSQDKTEDTSSVMDDDPKWDEAINIARTHGVVSASFLQRHLKIGYNRAARIVEGMEAQGLVAKADGAKPRRWLGSIV
ncbi:MAG: DNA translocase FtsK [Proteobacteria bacterium]|nr:DNA translocase FtsK [Pseudomonadota bacterium]